MISAPRAVSWRRDLKTHDFDPTNMPLPAALPLRNGVEHDGSTGSTRSAGSTLAREEPVPISFSVSRLPQKRPCGTHVTVNTPCCSPCSQWAGAPLPQGAVPRAPVSQVMLQMSKMIELACIESNEKYQRQKMLHKLLMLELDSANNKQQENKGVANESAETKDRNIENSTRTQASNQKSTQTKQYSPIAGHLSVILGPYTLMLTAYDRAQQQKQVVLMEPVKSINLSNVLSAIGATCNNGTPIIQYGVTIQRGYGDLSPSSHPEQLAPPAHHPSQRYNLTPVDSSNFMTLFMDALHGLPILDANGDDYNTPGARPAPQAETAENADTTRAAVNQPAVLTRTPPLPSHPSNSPNPHTPPTTAPSAWTPPPPPPAPHLPPQAIQNLAFWYLRRLEGVLSYTHGRLYLARYCAGRAQGRFIQS